MPSRGITTKKDLAVTAKRSIRVGAAGVMIRDGNVLLITFDDQHGTYYNYPGVGHQEHETLSNKSTESLQNKLIRQLGRDSRH
ncbi:MAG: hypothetical protein CL731_00495 [Chloroflexi bacterium]|nr:hypothetical protein [Chloroflexota bacterium]